MSNDFKITPAVLGALGRGDMANAIIAATPGGIERQEAEGQHWFQTAGVLPTEILHSEGLAKCEECDGCKGKFHGPNCTDYRPCETCKGSGRSPEAFAVLEATGFTFGDPEDGIFTKATIPDGWKFSALGHAMWSDLLDAEGSKRASVFYKAAFYDRTAHISFEPRYQVGYQEIGDYDEGTARSRYAVLDSRGRESALFVPNEEYRKTYDRNMSDEEASIHRNRWGEDRKACWSWLAENFPEHDNVMAYWD